MKYEGTSFLGPAYETITRLWTGMGREGGPGSRIREKKDRGNLKRGETENRWGTCVAVVVRSSGCYSEEGKKKERCGAGKKWFRADADGLGSLLPSVRCLLVIFRSFAPFRSCPPTTWRPASPGKIRASGRVAMKHVEAALRPADCIRCLTRTRDVHAARLVSLLPRSSALSAWPRLGL